MTPYSALLVIVTFIIFSGQCKAGNQTVKKKPEPPIALVVPYNTYDPKHKLPTLTHAVPSGVALAKQLATIGYRVEMVTGTDTPADLLRDLPKQVIVHREDEADGVGKIIQGWLVSAAKNPPPLAILSFIGHGEERDGTPYLFTRNSEPGSGGLSIALVDAWAKMSPLVPLVIVFDACRTVGAKRPKPSTDENSSPGSPFPKPEDRIITTKRNADGYWSTVIFAVGSGVKVQDRNDDMTGNLARVLEYKEETHKFMSFVDSEWGKAANQLTLERWVFYAMLRKLFSTHLLEIATIHWGFVKQTSVVAFVNQSKKLTPPVVAPLDRELLTEYTPRYGSFSADFDKERGWQIKRPLDLREKPFTVGGFGDSQVEVSNGVLVMDMIAQFDPKMVSKSGPKSMQFQLHPKHNVDESGKKDVYFSTKEQLYPIEYNRLYRLLLPLATRPKSANEMYKMNELAIGLPEDKPALWAGAWAPGAILNVSRLHVRHRNPDDSLQPKISGYVPDLLTSSWLPGDGKTELRLKATCSENAPYVWNLKTPQEGMSAKAAGPLLTPVFIPEQHSIWVEANNRGNSAVALTVTAGVSYDQEAIRMIVNQTIKFVPGSTVVEIPVSTVGFVNYLVLETASSNLQVKSIKVKPTKTLKNRR